MSFFLDQFYVKKFNKFWNTQAVFKDVSTIFKDTHWINKNTWHYEIGIQNRHIYSSVNL